MIFLSTTLSIATDCAKGAKFRLIARNGLLGNEERDSQKM